MRITTTHRRVGVGIAALTLSGAMFGGVAGATGNAPTGAVPTGAVKTTAVKGAAACPKGYLCVWPKTHYQGKMQKVSGNNKNLARFGGAFGSTVRSVYNHGASCDVRVYEKKNYTGRSYLIKKGYKGYGKGAPVRSNKWVNCA